jgi:hypothetical protein
LNGIPVVFLGSDARTVGAFWQGTQDFTDSGAPGTKRGTATSATITSLTDTTAAFEADVVGTELSIIDGAGRGQSRRIVERSATTLTVQYPWRIIPDETSVYQCGGVYWRWRSKRLRLPEGDQLKKTGVALTFQPQEEDCTAEFRYYEDFNKNAKLWKNPVSSTAGDGVRVDADTAPMTLDFTDETGTLEKRFNRKKSVGLVGPLYATIELSGVSNAEPVQVFEMSLEGLQ